MKGLFNLENVVFQGNIFSKDILKNKNKNLYQNFIG